MLIKKLTFHHFRQFYGLQTIEFSGIEDHRLATVILGENGRGKTGIYRGLLFALYGDIYLEQDPSGSDIVLANTKALQEDLESGPKGVNCSVTVEFVHQGTEYCLQRSLISIQDNTGQIIEQPDQVSLSSDRNLPETDSQKIDQFINQILDARVKNYFFFDGERIERLTRASHQQRKEIEYGIKNLLNIDHLLKTQKVIRTLNDRLTKRMQKVSSGTYKKKLKEKVETDSRITKITKTLHKLNDELLKQEVKIEELEKELESHQQGAEQIKQYKILEKSLNDKTAEYRHSFHRLREFNGTLQFLLAKDTLHRVNTKLDIILNDQQNESEVNLALIQDILDQMTCICGRKLQKGSSAYHNLKSLEKSISSKLEKRDIYQFNTEISKLVGYLETKEHDLRHLLAEVQKKNQEIERIQQDLDYLDERLQGDEMPDLAALHESRGKCIEAKIKLEQQIEQQNRLLAEAELKSKQLDTELHSLKIKSGIHQRLVQKQEILSKTLNAVGTIIKQYEKEVIFKLEKMTTANLKHLLDDSGLMNIQEVKVGHDYSLEILNTYGHSFLANISQGQRQVLSLSFITALAQIAGGQHRFEMPLFMDTPFGRLSSHHQINLLSFIPKVCSQWVLLVTDREFGLQERDAFINKDCWGKFYVLKSVEPGVTEIIQYNPDVAPLLSKGAF